MSETRAHGRPEEEIISDRTPLRVFLYSLRKAHREFTGDANLVQERFARVVTRGDAREYIVELLPRLLEEWHKRSRR